MKNPNLDIGRYKTRDYFEHCPSAFSMLGASNQYYKNLVSLMNMPHCKVIMYLTFGRYKTRDDFEYCKVMYLRRLVTG